MRVRVYECVDICMYGVVLGVWVYGCVGVGVPVHARVSGWVYGYMGVRVCGWEYGCVGI